MKNRLYEGKVYYGWYIVVAATIIMAVWWGIVMNTASLFINPISQELGLSRSAINFTFSIRSLCGLAISLLSGAIYRRFKLMNLMKIATFTGTLSIFAHSFIKSLGSLYLLTLISGISVILIGTLPISIILNNWFYEKNGTAVGFAFMGSGLGGMLFNSLAGKWIVTYGWRSTYQILASIMLLISIPLVFIIIKLEPHEVGLLAYGRTEEDNKGKLDEASDYDGLTLAEASKTLNFWAILFASAFITMSGVTLLNNIAPHLIDIGFVASKAANIVALAMGSLAVGKLILGYLFDRFGLRLTTLISVVFIIIGLFGLINAESTIAIIGVVLGVGIGNAYLTVAYPVITLKVFGRKDYSAIYGIISGAHSIGGIISPIVVGILFDRSGSYNSASMIMLVFAVISWALFELAFKKKLSIEAHS